MRFALTTSVAAAFVLAAVAACGAAPARVAVRRSERPATTTRCGRRRRSPRDYEWPVKPFDVQHPIRGGFGDPRTVSGEKFGQDESGDPGIYSFHNGVDISAKAGTPVYPVVTGRVKSVGPDEVRVRSRHHREFQYFHIRPIVHLKERVFARRTVIGYVKMPYRHVHLTEVDHWRVVNPLIHLRPYVDHTIPIVHALSVTEPDGHPLDPAHVSGLVTLTARADDLPPVPVPGAWNGFPLAPAVVRASLLSSTGRPVWQRVAADFTRREPTREHFWQVYAAGTYQNFPVFDNHYYWRRPGRYVFLLTHGALDTHRFPNGNYTVRVAATDECGNTGTLSEPLTISN